MSKHSIFWMSINHNLIGRASQLQRHNDHVSFFLTVDANGNQPETKVECRAWNQRDKKTFEVMDEGSLVRIIGHRVKYLVSPSPVLHVDRLEILGKLLETPA